MNNNFWSFLSNPTILPFILLWSLVWKGLALWKSAGKKQLPWFIILLIVNTMGLLEILYFFYLNRYSIDNGKLLALINKKLGKK